MSTNEIRRDYLLDRWVVIASKRERRSTDFIKAGDVTKPSLCPSASGMST